MSKIIILNFDGPNGSTDYLEEASGFVPNHQENCEIDTSWSKFGSGSLKLDAISDDKHAFLQYLGWQFSGDMTAHCFVKATEKVSGHEFSSIDITLINDRGMYPHNYAITFAYRRIPIEGGGWHDHCYFGVTDSNLGTWSYDELPPLVVGRVYHIAMVVKDLDAMLFIDGVKKVVIKMTAPMIVSDLQVNAWQGIYNIDAVEVVNEALWEENFTPPVSAPFTIQPEAPEPVPVLTLNFDGLEGSTEYLEEVSGLTPDVNLGCAIDTSWSKFGSGSLKFTHNIDGYVNLTYTIPKNVGDITISWYMKIVEGPDIGPPIFIEAKEDGGYSNLQFYYQDNGNTKHCRFGAFDSINKGDSFTYIPPLLIGTVHHIAMVVRGEFAMLFIDGVKKATVKLAAPLTVDTLSIWMPSYSGIFNIDALKVDHTARWQYNFAPPDRHDAQVDEVFDLMDEQDNEWTLNGETFFDQNANECMGFDGAQEAVLDCGDLLEESLDLEDLGEIGWPFYVDESLGMTESLLINWSKIIAESLFIYDIVKNGWSVSIKEDLTLAESLSEVLGLIVSDWITLVDSQTNNWQGRDIINDGMTLYDIAAQAQHYAKSISEDLTFADVPTWALMLDILEYLSFDELVKAIKTMTESVSESFAAADTPSWAFPESVTSVLQAVDVSSVIASFAHSLQDSIAAADTASVIKKNYDTITESLVVAEAISSKGTLYSQIYDTLHLNVVVDLAGDIYECYVLNTAKFFPSMYSGYDFNSFCVFENRAFGANDNGIYELTGTTDAGSQIHTGVILSKTDFGLAHKKRFRSGYLGISGTNPVMVMETDSGDRQAYKISSGKMIASHELKSRSWVLSVADFDTLDSIELIPVILTR